VLESRGERIVGGVNGFSICGPTRDCHKREGDIIKFTEANTGDEFVLGVPVETGKLLHSYPFPAAVSDMFVVSIFNFADCFRSIGKVMVRRGIFEF